MKLISTEVAPSTNCGMPLVSLPNWWNAVFIRFYTISSIPPASTIQTRSISVFIPVYIQSVYLCSWIDEIAGIHWRPPIIRYWRKINYYTAWDGIILKTSTYCISSGWKRKRKCWLLITPEMNYEFKSKQGHHDGYIIDIARSRVEGTSRSIELFEKVLNYPKLIP